MRKVSLGEIDPGRINWDDPEFEANFRNHGWHSRTFEQFQTATRALPQCVKHLEAGGSHEDFEHGSPLWQAHQAFFGGEPVRVTPGLNGTIDVAGRHRLFMCLHEGIDPVVTADSSW